MAFRSISTQLTADTTIHITPPSGIVDGDILIAFLIADSGNAADTVTWPSGFTEITGSPLFSAADGQRLAAATKKASSESGNYTIACTNGIIGGVMAFSGRDGTNYLHRISTGTKNTSQASPQSVTTGVFSGGNTTGTCDLVVIAGLDITTSTISVSWTPPTGFTSQATLSDNGGTGYRNGFVATKDAAASGETGAYTATATDTGGTAGWDIFAIALLDAATSPSVTGVQATSGVGTVVITGAGPNISVSGVVGNSGIGNSNVSTGTGNPQIRRLGGIKGSSLIIGPSNVSIY